MSRIIVVVFAILALAFYGIFVTDVGVGPIFIGLSLGLLVGLAFAMFRGGAYGRPRWRKGR
ncbi:hypothetical protein [Candidatus Desulforudis audaxviator]|uniref:hypothetical protein n=1 Tax=Candidatus Desulforudis audaxviator TaxID=471827 RepID=UPI0002E57358|nr:hypothetical protein [Candidatus Desulforudis audaxviator]AZK60451.1 hypothetical protein Daudx_1920 [Candidatus Desulforudis audaxviator]